MKVTWSSTQCSQDVQSNALSWTTGHQATDTRRTVDIWSPYLRSKQYYPCLAPKLATCAVNLQWWTFRFIVRQTSLPRFLCSYLHLGCHVADMQAVLHTQTGAGLTSDWQVRHEITNQKHLPSFRPSHLPSHLDASQWNIYLSFHYCHSYSPPLQTLEVIWKLETCERPASVATYGWSDCGNYLCHLLWTYSIWVLGLWWKQLKVGDLGDGGKIQMAKQWRDQSRTIHPPPHFSAQADVI